MAECQQEFDYQPPSVLDLNVALSRARMKQFTGSKDSSNQAFDNYLWNARLSKAFRFPLEIAEVTFRNRIESQLTDRYQDWPRSAEFRATAAVKTVEKLDEALARVGHRAQKSHLVNALSFGFWTALMSGRFVEGLWRERLTQGFPNLPKSVGGLKLEDQTAHVYNVAKEIKEFRNDIAHLKPIYLTDLSHKHGQVLHLIRICCRTTATWVGSHSTITRELRLGAVSSSGMAVNKGWTGFNTISSDAKLCDLIVAVESSARPYVILSHDGGYYLVSAATISSWIAKNQEAGLVDLEVPAGKLVDADLETATLARRATLWESRQYLTSIFPISKRIRNAAIITETGSVREKPLAIVELGSLL